MKEEAHPDYHPVIFKDGEHEVTTRSTLTSKKTREVDGVEHYVISVDISAFTHPFYTGKQKLVDTEGRVDRFMKRYNLTTSEEKAAAGAKGEEPGDEEAEEQAEEATEESAEESAE
jgi:large subunit ribosomal protein L31